MSKIYFHNIPLGLPADDHLDYASVNPVQNKVIAYALDEKLNAGGHTSYVGQFAYVAADGTIGFCEPTHIDFHIDTAMSDDSAYAVENRVIKHYVDDAYTGAIAYASASVDALRADVDSIASYAADAIDELDDEKLAKFAKAENAGKNVIVDSTGYIGFADTTVVFITEEEYAALPDDKKNADVLYIIK